MCMIQLTIEYKQYALLSMHPFHVSRLYYGDE